MTAVDTVGMRQWERLSRKSDRLLDDIGTQRIDGHIGDSWYIRRDIEAPLLDDIVLSGSEPQIIVGEAGHGKSTLLWSLHQALRRQERSPLLVSATWLQRSDTGEAETSNADIVSAVTSRPGSIVLLDTADLLLHSPAARGEVIDLIDELARAGVPIVVTTRPQESRSLPANLGRKHLLGPYDPNSELPAAVDTLVDEFTTDRTVMPDDPIAAIHSARARGLLVDDVCTSPLLLRLLFSLSTPAFPDLELDVTELYKQFWERRIASDHRLGPYVYRGDGDDLSGTAGFLGIAMLALGTPEPSIDVLVRQTVRVAAASNRPLSESDVRAQVQTLTRRGVLIASDDRIRFLHQTFFEYAAAQGLAARSGDAELIRLIERLTAAPDDLFLGAVVEQALIILGADPLAESTVRDSCQALVDSEHPHLTSIAMTTWAHHPTVLELSTDTLDTVADDDVRRFLRTLPGVHSDTAPVAEHLCDLWTRRPQLRTAIATTAAQLSGRAPGLMVDVVRRTEMYIALADSHQPYLRSNSEPHTLLSNLAHHDPDLVRAALITTMDGLTDPTKQPKKDSGRLGKQTVARYLRLTADRWNALSDTVFMTALEDTITTAQARSRDSDAEIVRDAFGAVIAADIDHRGLTATGAGDLWLDWVHDVCVGLERVDGDRDPIVGARLIALGLVLTRLSTPDHEHLIAATLERLFTLSGAAAPRQLARGCLTQILNTASPARTCLVGILSALLDGHLPAEHQNFTPGPSLWAAVTRQTLMDSAIPASIVHQVLDASIHTYGGDDRLFTTGNHLVALAPAAIVHGEPAAVDAATALSLVDTANTLDRQAANIFLDHARERAHEHPGRMIGPTVSIARRIGRTGTIKDLLLREDNHPALRADGATLLRWVDELVSGNDGTQQAGADLLRLLVEDSIVTPTLDQLMSWLDQATNPYAKANLLATIAICARQTGVFSGAAALFSRYVTTASGPPPSIAASAEHPARPVVVEAARDALLETLAHYSDSYAADWNRVHVLTFAPRLTGTKRTDVAGLRHLARFLRNEAEAGHIDDALVHLHATCSAVADLDKNKRVKASNKLKGSVSAILRRAQSQHYDQLADLVRIAPPQTTIQLVHGLLDSPLFADRAREFAHRLNIIPRLIGTGTFPEILDPAAPQPIPPPPTVVFSPPPGITDGIQRLVHAAQRLKECRRALEQASDQAYHAIRRHAGSKNDEYVASLLHLSPSGFYRLKARDAWEPPSLTLCRAVDNHGRAIEQNFELVKLRSDFEKAKQAEDDARHARD